MRTQYFCSDARRKQEVANSENGLNGIDYLEVVDRDYITEMGLEETTALPLRQRTLLVHCLKPLAGALTAENVIVKGGVRITPIEVEWAALGSDLSGAGPLLPQEAAYLSALPDGPNVVVVRTDRRGDFSTYRLSLVASQDDSGPPAGFDELLSQVPFSFKVECPSDFDCRTEAVCPPEPADEPLIDYLNKDYASFRRLILDRLSVIMPDWRERNPADLGVTLVELLAYAGDRLSYYQDAVAAEAYLGTARRRVSVRRHARLLDYHMHDGCNARVWVAFEVDAGSDGAVLRAVDEVSGIPTRLLTKVPQAAVIAANDLARVLSEHQPQVFELLHDLPLYQSHNEIAFYQWRDQECCLPRGATRAALVDDEASRLRIRSGDVLVFEERLDPTTGQEADADPARRHAVRLTEVTPAAEPATDGGRTPGPLVTDPLTSQPIVEIAWAAEDALPFPLCISTRIQGELVQRVSVARGNVVLASHGMTIAGEELPATPSATTRRRYRPRLEESGLTFHVPHSPADLQAAPAARSIQQDPREALPHARLEIDGRPWRPRRDLLDSRRFDRHFVAELEPDGVARLRFARPDDRTGAAPPAAAVPIAAYRVGNGNAGNVGAESIAHVVVDDTNAFRGVLRVRNPLAAQGGLDAESSERVRLDAPQAFRVQQRAVTERDYAEVAQRHHEVQQAVATRRWTGSWHTMFLTVDRRAGRPVDDGFRVELRRFLERFRLVGHDLEIDSPQFVPLEIVMTVCIAAGYFRSDVKSALRDVFSNRDLPDGRRGYFHPDNFTFGQPVYVSRIVAAAMGVAGVLWVDLTDRTGTPNRFRRFGQAAHGEFNAGLIELDRLEIARLDNDPSQPENGRIEFLMRGGA